ncbi:MAG: hypothetical protein WEE51_11725, partial [Pirellulaceae bacterium]
MTQSVSDIEALGILVPMILSTKRLDGDAVVGKLGEAIRGLARVATGCLSAMICLPLLLFGLFFGHWNAIGLAILLINGTIGLTCAVIEYRYRRQYRREVGPELLAPSPGEATAGPLNP